MKMRCSFTTRAGTALAAPPGLNLSVESYGNHIIGGPQVARIVATGKEEDLWDCIPLLRCGVEIIDERGDCVWWGYVHEVRVAMDAAEWGLGIDEMANSIAVAYTTQEGTIAAGGIRGTTAYATDAISIAEYGERQLLLTANNVTAAAATAMRDTALATIGWPMPISDLSEGDGAKVVLICKGWWETLGWKYYANPQGIYGYLATPDQRQNVGDSVSQIEIIWTMPAGSDTFDTIGMYYYKSLYGTPVANLSGEIRQTDRNGTVLATWTITPADVAAVDGGQGGYIEKALSATITGSTSPLCILLNRVGGAELLNHYQIGCTNLQAFPYATANFNQSGWFGSNFDFVFKFTRKDNAITQISNMLTTAGQFITAIDVETTTTVTSNPNRAGDATAQMQIEELLDVPGALSRLAIEITRDRRARIFSEPLFTEMYYVDRYMNPYGRFGERIERQHCPYGIWVSLKDFVPISSGSNDAVSGVVGFVESATYNVKADRWIPHFRKNKNAFMAAGGKR